VVGIGLASDLERADVAPRGYPWTLVAPGGARQIRRGPLMFRPKAAPPVYRVQVGGFSEEATARRIAAEFASRYSAPSTVVFSAERGLYLARIGAFADAAAARALLAQIVGKGVDAFLVTEPSGGASLLLTDESGVESVLPWPWMDIAPAEAGDFVVFRDRRYRGRLRVLVSPRGLLNVVNEVGIEDYLKGVVPAEMGPKRFDEIEALKAQAVAARTYALANRGSFAPEGYDLCATPKCQVYAGVDAEDPLSNAAVEATRGLIATYGGQPIQAYFTSTCGGHTEDGGEVFSTAGAPYLKGVVCGEANRTVVVGAGFPRRLAKSRTPLEWRGWVLRRVASTRGWNAYRSQAWKTALGLAGVPAGGSGPPAENPAAAYPAVVKAFGLVDAERIHLTDLDRAYDDGPPDAAGGLPERARTAYELFLRMGIVSPDALPPPDGRLSADELDGLLFSVALRLKGVTELRGRFVRREGGDLILKTADGRASVPADPSIPLARMVAGRFLPASELALAAGDPVGVWKRGDRVLALWAEYVPAGATYEKESTWTEWVRRVPGRELMRRISSRVSGTEVVSVRVTRRGPTGRALEAEIRTNEASIRVSGFDLRQALELPELLFTVEKTRGADGSPEFVFLGRGWGHGVGLCQNGAYGMALGGAKFDEILKHYYTGIEIAPIQSAP
jgi:stage II sporulation protein D